ncbi:hypothetical protein EMMF5_005248 [Cystobasidiomycetes sp. EMM_F5]
MRSCLRPLATDRISIDLIPTTCYMTTIAVTGATGELGGLVLKCLLAASTPTQNPIRLLVREPNKIRTSPAYTVYRASYEDVTACVDALTGARVLLMISAPEGPGRMTQHRSLIDACIQAKTVQHIVYTSFRNASPDAVFQLAREHYQTESYIIQAARRAGFSFTFLRNNFYMDILRDFAHEDNIIRGPAGPTGGRISAVAKRDIAEAATNLLLAPETHRGRTYDLTGPKEVSLIKVASLLTLSTGERFAYQDEEWEEGKKWRIEKYRAADWQVEAWLSTYTAIQSGEAGGVSDDITTLLGRSPMSLQEFLGL